jgi:predicted nucleic acid-binding protein
MSADRSSRAVVVDASALAALLFGEPEAEEVVARLGERDLLAPTLLPYEVGSVGLKKLNRYRSQRAAIRQAMELFTRLGVRQIEVPVVAVVELAELKGLTVYDAAYLWLARVLGCELVTLDRALEAASGD